MPFSDILLSWYDENARQLPWRGIDNPYYIWLSEIILQQTRIEQGMAYYHHFVSQYPTVRHLAAASEDQVLKSWQGLGYYSRARNLHKAAKFIVSEYDGVFPSSYEDILKLSGVGRYTAAAIASFAFRLPYPVIDGNVYRFVARLFGIYTPIGTDAAYREFESLLSRLMDRERPDRFNQALMDFGSTYCIPFSHSCKPRQTVLDNCSQCVFRQQCVAFRTQKVAFLPVKPTPPKIQTRYFYYLHLLWTNDNVDFTLVRQRTGRDIWKGLYEFPLVESLSPIEDESLTADAASMIRSFCVAEWKSVMVSQPFVHKLTHRTIVARFIDVALSSPPLILNDELKAVSNLELKSLPISRLMDRYLSSR